MNRLVIIGNGFDLAHGLPTGYCDFINDYWRNVVSSVGYDFLVTGFIIYEDSLMQIRLHLSNFDYYTREPLMKEYQSVNTYSSFKEFKSRYNSEDETADSVNFKNKIFKNICEMHSIKNWVDVENEYYKLLKDCLKENDNSKVKELNIQFAEIKNLLENYLTEKVENTFTIKANQNYYQLFFPEMDPKFSIDEYRQEFLENEGDNVEIGYNAVKAGQDSITSYILNFNYTSMMQKTVEEFENSNFYYLRLNNIHGSLDDESNPINFGFGDEMDKHYNEIEEKDDNEYLKNIKSFAYLNTTNYKQLLDFLDYKKYQVLIMGHSCGLSDRTLLNTIFEHSNCRSIKVFYHKKEDGSDNYTEIIQNISRHFNKKKLMREKIVNKTLCQPLPQIQLPKKETSNS